MKKRFFILLLCFSPILVNSQTFVTLTLPDNCNATDIETPISTDTETILRILPNPNSGIFTLSANFKENIGNAEILVHTMKGKLIYAEHLFCDTKRFVKQINMNGFHSGTYIIEIVTEKQKESTKLIIKY